jgi:hypothetical protein
MDITFLGTILLFPKKVGGHSMAPKTKWDLQSATAWIKEMGFSYIALSKINHPKKVLFIFQCPYGTKDEYDLAEIRKQVAKGIIPCKCCRRKAKLQQVMETFRNRGFTPLDLEKDYEGVISYVACRNEEGYIVLAQELNSKEVSYSPFIFSNPYSIQNIKKLAQDIGFKDLESKDYIDYDTAYTAVDNDGFLYSVYIGNMLRIQRNGRNYTVFQKYVENGLYLEYNIHCSALQNGYIPLPETLDATEKTIGATNPAGYLVVYNPYQLEGAVCKPPNPFDSRNRYYYENLQKLINEKGLPIRVDQKRKIGITDDGYFVTLRYEEIKEGKMPQRFHESNPFSMRNIRLFCRKFRPDYRPVKGQVFRSAKTKYLFIYLGRDLKPGANEKFPVDWSNFQNGRGHPHRLREVCKNGISNNFKELRNVISNSEWRKNSLNKTNGNCILTGETQHIEVHHLFRPYPEIVEEAIIETGLGIKPYVEYAEEERKRIVDEFVIIHAREPLGVPLARDVHRCFHRWIDLQGLPVNESSFKAFKKVWKEEYEEWKVLKLQVKGKIERAV